MTIARLRKIFLMAVPVLWLVEVDGPYERPRRRALSLRARVLSRAARAHPIAATTGAESTICSKPTSAPPSNFHTCATRAVKD
ncbi:hypothetical protein GCM10023192_02380 [Amycolatopsis samaneae]